MIPLPQSAFLTLTLTLTPNPTNLNINPKPTNLKPRRVANYYNIRTAAMYTSPCNRHPAAKKKRTTDVENMTHRYTPMDHIFDIYGPTFW